MKNVKEVLPAVSTNVQQTLAVRHSTAFYVGTASVFVACVGAALVFPASEIVESAAGMTGVGALIGALFQIFRDQADFEKQLLLQRDAQQQEVLRQRDDQHFQIGVTSHMANTVFDKHVVFCETYLKEVHGTIDTLVREGPCPDALKHADNLIGIRREHVAWVTISMSQRLVGFESAIRKIGAKSHFVRSTAGHERYAERRDKLIEQVEAEFERVLPQLFGDDETEDGIAAETVVKRVREILDIERLVELRTGLIGRAHASLPKN